MLEFNPAFRPSTKQILANPIFDKFRNHEQQVEAPLKVFQAMHIPGNFDYKSNKDVHFTTNDYR